MRTELNALKRMLANGPLTAIPKRPGDQRVLLSLAAAQFEAQKTYREREVNDILQAWLETFCDPDGIDRVTLRRMLVDARLLSRTKSGSTYSVNRPGTDELTSIEPAKILEEVRSQREARKRRHDA